MKNINILEKFKYWAFYISILFSVLAIGCSDDKLGWNDARYMEDFEIYITHVNPLTGVDYTEEELAALSYDPRERESYSEGQNIDLSVISSKLPVKIEVLSGLDLSVLATLTKFTPSGEKFISENYITDLEALGLMVDGDKMGLKFQVEYMDGSIGSVLFGIRRVKFFDPSAAVDYFAFLKKGNAETVGLLTDNNVAATEKDPKVGIINTLNGSSNSIEITNIPELSFRGTDNFSVGLWVNTTSTNDDPSIIADKDWGSGSNPGFIFVLTGGTWKLNAGDGTNRIDINGNAINDGNWHFLMATFDRAGKAIIYEDGVATGNADISGFGDMSSGHPIRIGQDGPGAYGEWYEGQVGEVYIYDYALTPEQVAGVSTVKTGAQLIRKDGIIKNINVVSVGGVVASNENGKFTFNLDGSDDAVAWDNGVDLNFRHTDDFSIATWVKTTAGNSDPAIIGDKDWGGGANKGFIFAYQGGSWKFNVGDGEGKRVDIDGGAIGDGEWHLLAVTMDKGGNATLYQDGKEVGSGDISGFADMNSGFPIRLGQDGTGNYGEWFQGKVANSRIFDYVLTADQVKALFNE